MTPRVPLYGCYPAGVGTPLVESLTSYICRLAAARNLGTADVVEHLVLPEVPPELRPKTRNVAQYLSRDAVGLDGTGELTELVVMVLEDLTGLAKLAEHTLLPWERVLSESSPGAILRSAKRWCSRCFEEWHRKGIQPWEPLIWRVAPVERCPIHATYFSNRCPSCRMPQPAVTKLVPIGRCSRCGAFLHVGEQFQSTNCGRLEPGDEDAWKMCMSIAVGRMLGLQAQALLRASSDGFVHLLIEAVNELAGGKSSKLAERLGVSYASLNRWASHRTRPQLDYFLAVSIRLGADPAAVGLYPYGAAFTMPWKV